MKKTIIALAVGALGACATVSPSTLESSPANTKVIVNTVNTSVDFDVVWDSVVSKLSQSFFVINNIDKQSRIINVSFTANQPESYVDCGRSKRTFDFQKEHAVYDYPIAGSNTFKFAATWNPSGMDLPAVYTLNRQTKLEGRANIYVAPGASASGSVVSVNAIYVWSVSLTGYMDGYNAFGGLVQPNVKVPPEVIPPLNFTTQEAGVDGVGADRITCASTGKFEESILSFVPRQK